jgi:DNA-binding SARP family transcriptional activator
MFGGFSIAAGGNFVHSGLGANGRRLSAFLLAFPNSPHRRARLIDLFWPDLDASRASAAFSTALWRLRRLFSLQRNNENLHIRSTAQELVLELGDSNIVDVHHFQSLVSDAFHSVDLTIDLKRLDRAIGLYAGPFLDGDDDDWILEQRERLHCLYVRALTELMRWFAGQDRYEDALVCGRRILACDPVREMIQRWVMLLYLLNGQRGEAMRQFERCDRVLRGDYDVEPMPETSSLAAMIRSGEVFSRLTELRHAMLVGGARDPFLLSLR